MTNPEKIDQAISYRKKHVGTFSYLWSKWWRKFWQAYPAYASTPTAEPPLWMRRQFYRDVRAVVEAQLAVLAPEKTMMQRQDALDKILRDDD